MILAHSLIKMAGNNAVLNRLEQKGAEADQVIEYLKQQVALLKEKAMKQIPTAHSHTASFSEGVSQPPSTEVAPPTPKDQSKGAGEEKKKKEKTEKKVGEKKEKKQQSASDDSKPVDVSRLDLRIGCITTVKKHPDADSLYVEEVDVGEPNLRTVVSGLVKHVPLEEMQNRMGIFLCNLKPAKMRGVVSQAMLMCASSPEKVEILAPPNGVVPGERVTFEGFPGEPEKELNPKKKMWEQIQPDLHTNDQCVATYKGVPFEVKGKGVCKAATMANSGIK